MDLEKLLMSSCQYAMYELIDTRPVFQELEHLLFKVKKWNKINKIQKKKQHFLCIPLSIISRKLYVLFPFCPINYVFNINGGTVGNYCCVGSNPISGNPEQRT